MSCAIQIFSEFSMYIINREIPIYRTLTTNKKKNFFVQIANFHSTYVYLICKNVHDHLQRLNPGKVNNKTINGKTNWYIKYY